MKHAVDKHFKKLKQLEEQPPLEAWAAIEKELDKRSKRRTPIIWLWRRAAIAASFLLFVGVGSYLYWMKKNRNPKSMK